MTPFHQLAHVDREEHVDQVGDHVLHEVQAEFQGVLPRGRPREVDHPGQLPRDRERGRAQHQDEQVWLEDLAIAPALATEEELVGQQPSHQGEGGRPREAHQQEQHEDGRVAQAEHASATEEIVADVQVHDQQVQRRDQQVLGTGHEEHGLAVATDPQGEEHSRQHGDAPVVEERGDQPVDEECIDPVQQEIGRVPTGGVGAEEPVLDPEQCERDGVVAFDGVVAQQDRGVGIDLVRGTDHLEVLGVPEGIVESLPVERERQGHGHEQDRDVPRPADTRRGEIRGQRRRVGHRGHATGSLQLRSPRREAHSTMLIQASCSRSPR
jgi:hypothetical protein